jgi:hypothetical protein
MVVIPTGASHSRREWEAQWRDLVFVLRSHISTTASPASFPKYPFRRNQSSIASFS